MWMEYRHFVAVVVLGLVLAATGILLWSQFKCLKCHPVWRVVRELCQGKNQEVKERTPPSFFCQSPR